MPELHPRRQGRPSRKATRSQRRYVLRSLSRPLYLLPLTTSGKTNSRVAKSADDQHGSAIRAGATARSRSPRPQVARPFEYCAASGTCQGFAATASYKRRGRGPTGPDRQCWSIPGGQRTAAERETTRPTSGAAAHGPPLSTDLGAAPGHPADPQKICYVMAQISRARSQRAAPVATTTKESHPPCPRQ